MPLKYLTLNLRLTIKYDKLNIRKTNGGNHDMSRHSRSNYNHRK